MTVGIDPHGGEIAYTNCVVGCAGCSSASDLQLVQTQKSDPTTATAPALDKPIESLYQFQIDGETPVRIDVIRSR